MTAIKIQRRREEYQSRRGTCISKAHKEREMETVRNPPEPFIIKQERGGKAKGHRRKGD